MKEELKRDYGITLVALIITIIILLILAGISIQVLSQTNLFEQAKLAKNTTDNAQKEENKTLSEYIDEINEYLPETLVYKVNSREVPIGSYIKYTPDTVNGETLNKLIEELGTYSGSEANTKETLKQEMELNWRVLDVKDGQVRLISDVATTSTIAIKGYNGYNNAVYLLDDICNKLYNNSKLTNKVQNLKIEDIEQYLKDKIVVSENKISPAGIKYPQIVEQEENQTINNITGTLKPSEQTELINQTEVKIATSSSLKRTYKWKKLNEESFKNSKYYTMFFNDGENTKRYWLSTREIYTASDYATFGIGCLRVWNYRWTTFV